jgi:hypothetical protein
MSVAANPAPIPSNDSLQAEFQRLLPHIQAEAGHAFRSVACAQQRSDRIAEAVALGWQWFLRLVERGKDVFRFQKSFVFSVIAAVRRGRRLCGQESTTEVLSFCAQRQYGFTVLSLLPSPRTAWEHLHSAPRGQSLEDAYEDRLRDDAVTPVPDQAAFRVDWPQFLRKLSRRDRRLAAFLALGHSAKKAAHRFQLSPGRVTQLRQQWCREWQRFQGEAEDGLQGEGPKTWAKTAS